MTPVEYARHTKRIVIDESTGCWVWQGAKLKSARPGAGGYAIANVGGKTQLLHRAMYEHQNGPIPPGLHLDHLCRVRACINPEHLEPVTQTENTMRGVGPTKKNTLKTECPNGHSYSGDNLYVDKSGRRHCRECNRARTRNWYANQGGREWRRKYNASH